MNEDKAVFAEKSMGYFVCENIEYFATQELLGLKSVAMEIYGHRVTVSFIYHCANGFVARTYYGDHVDSVKEFFSDASEYLREQYGSTFVDNILCCALANSQLEVRYKH